MFGYLHQDDSGDWYLIPEKKVKRFSMLIDKMSSTEDWEKRDEIANKIIDEFDKYRLSGGVENLRIVMEND